MRNDFFYSKNFNSMVRSKRLTEFRDNLLKMPSWDISKNDKNLFQVRKKLPAYLLKELIIKEEGYKKLEVELLRKLDLSCLDFFNVDVRNLDLSYTNICLDPQRVKNKSLYGTNCMGLDFRDKDFFSVDVRGAIRVLRLIRKRFIKSLYKVQIVLG